jgi:hypothetical protein
LELLPGITWVVASVCSSVCRLSWAVFLSFIAPTNAVVTQQNYALSRRKEETSSRMILVLTLA